MRMGRPTAAVALAAGGFAAVLILAPAVAARSQDSGKEQPASTPISFNREILPILANNCFACHGPDEKQRETKFHFDTREAALLKRGVIEPGNAAESLLIEKVTDPDPNERMPPLETGHKLTDKQIDSL